MEPTSSKGTLAVAISGDPRDPKAFSGTSLAVVRALEGEGWRVRALRAELPRPLRLLPRAVPGPWRARLASASAERDLRRAGETAGVIQIGTEFALDTDVPLVTYEDMTVRQASAYSWSGVPGLPERTVAAWIERQQRIYERARACCVLTRWAARSIIDDYGIPAEKVHVVGAGCNRTPSAAERDWSVPRFLFAGRDWKRKNAEGLVRAFAELRRELPAAELNLVGSMPEFDQPGVIHHGALELDRPEDGLRLERLFEQATCFVMPSWLEPLGVVYVEAALAGVPSIATTAGGASDVIAPGCGLLVDPGDHADLVDAMRTMADPQTAERMGAAARERARPYTWAAVGQRLVRALGLGGEDPALAPFLYSDGVPASSR